MSARWLVLVESNTTGSGRLFCSVAREAGLRPLLLAKEPDRYPYVSEDNVDVLVTDTGDTAEVLSACVGLGGPVAGVTSSSEYFIAVAAETARVLGLPHADPAAVRACRDKRTQRARLAAAGVPCPASLPVRSPAEAVAAAVRLGFPVVVKPVTGSGSLGVRLCADQEEVTEAAGAVLRGGDGLRSLPRQDGALVEEYARGPEYSVELLDGVPLGVTSKYLGPEPYFVETGHDFPAPLRAGERELVVRTATAALTALGLGWGAAHVEIRLTGAGPRVIEVNPRLAGGMIPRLVSEALGIDVIEHLIMSVVNRPRPLRPSCDAAASIRFLVVGERGRITKVSGVSAARSLPHVVDVRVTGRPGSDVRPPTSFSDRLGYVIAAAGTVTEAAQAAEAGVRVLDIAISPEREGAQL